MYHIQVKNNISNAKTVDIIGSEKLCSRIIGLAYLGSFNRFTIGIYDTDTKLKKTPKTQILSFLIDVFGSDICRAKEFLTGFIKF